jgi:Skp family chaperone for outer membrane proteins
MTNLLKPAMAAGIALAALSAPLALAPASAQAARPAAAAAGTVRGIAVVNAPAVLVNSSAFKAATQQRPVTYKAQIDQYNARRAAITAQLQPLVTKYQTDSSAPNPNQASLQQQAAQIQQIQDAAQRELQQIVAPVQLSEAYVEEQLQERLGQAIENAAKKRGVTLVLSPDNILYADGTAYNLSQQVVDELNLLIPAAQLVPPAGWLPRELREQQAQQAAQQQAAQGAPAPAAPAVRAPAPAAGPPAVQGR